MADPFSPRDFVLGIVAGCLLAAALIGIGVITYLRTNDFYSLDHWKLNVQAPFCSMWINLGFWETHEGKPIERFNEATRALLEKMLQAAGLSGGDGDGSSTGTEALGVLDVGFGCGDQTVALAELVRAEKRSRFRYVGLTLNAAQLQTAQRRVERALAVDLGAQAEGAAGVVGAAGAAGSGPGTGGSLSLDSFKLFRANAARPETWSKDIRSSVDNLGDDAFCERWLMALDTLYHFSPSRKPIFKLAAGTLGAHIMAFDMVLNEEASMWNKLLVRLVGVMMGCPMGTFLTEARYREQLVECGYDRAHIEIRDISNQVFAGVSGCLRRQEAALSQYGISMGGFKLAGRLFEWFDRTRVVKASIVVARTKGKAE